MNKALTLIMLGIAVLFVTPAGARTVIEVPVPAGDATAALAQAIGKASQAGDGAEIHLGRGEFHFHADHAAKLPYRVSNTASEAEHGTAVKHVGMLLKGLRNVMLRGSGKETLIVTHGEMTPWVIDSCTDVKLCNLVIDAADPSVAEMTVTSIDGHVMTARPHSQSAYVLRDGKLYWRGEGWEFTDGVAQLHNPAGGQSLRCESPIAEATAVEALPDGELRLTFGGKAPEASVGDTYQMRHSIRSEVAGLINASHNITLSDIEFGFMGNFGVVAQMSTNLTYRKLRCAPREATGRTNAGFADFLQVSSCGGRVVIDSCEFAGSHDDPINIHGTHQLVTASGDSTLIVRYMHPQTFGFKGFNSGDTIAVTDPRTLLTECTAVVSHAVMTDPYTTLLTLDRPADHSMKGMVIENLTMTPAVRITGCSFTLTPTRGVLVTTRRPVVIEGCRFVKCPMAAILIADDGRSWYESGAVRDVTITGNRFIDCSQPVISIAPEADPVDGRYVHSNIRITGNEFVSDEPTVISALSVDGLHVSGNRVTDRTGASQELKVDCRHTRLKH